MIRLRSFHRLFADDHGAVAIIFALALPLLMAGLALAVEIGLHLSAQNKLQSYADVAAFSAAVALSETGDQQVASAAAHRSVHNSGGDLADISVSVDFPTEDRVQVSLSETRPMILFWVVPRDEGARGAMISRGFTLELNARAVAALPGQVTPTICVLALATRGTGIELDGNSRLEAPECDVVANSRENDAIDVSGNATLVAGCVITAGEINGSRRVTTTLCDEPVENSDRRPLPVALEELPELERPWSVPDEDLGRRERYIEATYTGHPSGVPMRRFRGGLELDGRETYTFAPGIYIIDGGEFQTENRTEIIADRGVAFYLMNGAELRFHQGTIASFSGLRTGPWQGIVFFDSNDRDSDQQHEFTANRFEGVVYLPRAELDIGDRSEISGGCFLIVVSQLKLDGGADVEVNCENPGLDLGEYFGDEPADSGAATTVRLVE